jgi:hypothetical protein
MLCMYFCVHTYKILKAIVSYIHGFTLLAWLLVQNIFKNFRRYIYKLLLYCKGGNLTPIAVLLPF